MVSKYIGALVDYGTACGLLPEEEKIYAVNLLLDMMGCEEYEEQPHERLSLEEILKGLTDIAVEKGLIEDGITYRELFDTKLMNALVPRPKQVIDRFWDIYHRDGAEAATQEYYKFSQDTNYIRRYRICRDLKWTVDSEYGPIDITINLSKPEKDPKAIAAAGKAKQSGYPKCLLCMENEGYAGRINHPARQNHRIIPLTLAGDKFGLQYSPYVYYNEHCIVFHSSHVSMKIDETTFRRLFDFVKLFPHYFLGSNADLPIVGGSILSHDHFQGGHYTFAMEKAEYESHFKLEKFPDVEAGIVHWPLSVIRLRHEDSGRLVEAGAYILQKWRSYTDEDAFIYAETDGQKHNTITPIARKRDGVYELDLALRNNITTEEHPLGVYHPNEKLHHIKKENIGLIEVMGLAVLPSRLKDELEELAECLVEGTPAAEKERIAKHSEWAEELKQNYEFTKENAMDILKKETGKVFVQVLEDAGVYKCSKEGREAFARFITYLNQ